MRIRHASVAAAAVLALAACGSSHSTARKAPPADGGNYPSAQALLDQLAHDGIACADQPPVANPTVTGALSMADCNGVGSADSDTVVIVYDTHENAVAGAKNLLAFNQSMGGDPEFEVVGVNWGVNTVNGYGLKVLTALGGTHVQS